MMDLRKASVLAGCLALSGWGAAAEEKVNYVDHIRPIFQQSCFNCHNPDKAKAGLDLTTYRAAIAGGSVGEVVYANDLDGSVLYGVMAHTLEPKMPPKGGKVADKQLALVRQWIEQGLRETSKSSAAKPEKPRVDLSVGKAAIGRPDKPIMPRQMPLGPIHHTPREGAVVSVAAHPWSPIVAVAGQKQVLVYSTVTDSLLGVLPFEHGQPRTLRFSWSGKLLMVGGGVGGQSGTVVLYDVESGEAVSQVGEEFDAVLAADLDPKQRYVALGGPSKLVKGYDVATGEMVYKIDKHTEWVTAIAFSPTGDYLATGDRNGRLHVWEADSGLPVFTLDGHNESVTALAWRFDGKLLASVGEDGQAKLWEMNDGKQHKAWGAHNGGARSVSFASDGRLVTTGRDQHVKVWAADGKLLHQVKPFEEIGLSVGFDAGGQAVVAGDWSGRLVRWSLEDDAKQVAQWQSNPPTVEVAIALSSERVSEAAEALRHAEAQAKAARETAEQAGQTHADAVKGLADAKQAIIDTERAQRQSEQDRKKTSQQRDKANQKREAAQGPVKTARERMQAVEREVSQANREHQQASRESDQAADKLKRIQEQLTQASEKSEKNPEDANATKRAEELAKQAEEAHKQADQKQVRLSVLAEALASVQKKLDAHRQAYEKKQAEYKQLDEAAKAAYEAVKQAGEDFNAAREAHNQAKQSIKPAEQKLEGAEKEKARAKEALAKVEALLEQVRVAEQQAARDQAKWRAESLRLKIQAMRREDAKPSAIAPLLDEYKRLRELAGFEPAELNKAE